MVERLETLATYCTGWSKGNALIIRSAVADDYLWDDPDEGRITKADLKDFLPRLRDKIDDLRNRSAPASYLTLSDLVIDRRRSATTVWCRFAVPGTGIQGMSQIRVGDNGVISEHRAHRTQAHDRVAGVRGRG